MFTHVSQNDQVPIRAAFGPAARDKGDDFRGSTVDGHQGVLDRANQPQDFRCVLLKAVNLERTRKFDALTSELHLTSDESIVAGPILQNFSFSPEPDE